MDLRWHEHANNTPSRFYGPDIAQAFQQALGAAQFIECSAKMRVNVDQVFKAAVQQLHALYLSEERTAASSGQLP
jgi:hypothetical protein